MANRTVLRSNFKLAAKAGKDAAEAALRDAGNAMHEEAANRLDKAAGARGYNLYSTDLELDISDDDAEIRFPHFYGRFFEYGTPTINAMPFMRPGHRKGRKVLKETLEDDFEKWVARRARIR